MFSHVTEENQPTMVDVSKKSVTLRFAEAQSEITLPPEVLELFNGKEINSKKGPVFQTAIIAGTMAAKKTHELIPFCHQINLDAVQLIIQVMDNSHAQIKCQVRCEGRTGVEMEALTGAVTAALTIYDMCKAFSKDMVIRNVALLEKRGGKSDYQK